MKGQGTLRCIVYLSVAGELEEITEKERRQLHYIREYARANRIEIAGILHRGGLGQFEVNRQINAIIREIEAKKYDGILIANMAAVSVGISDAYTKVGKIIEIGGHIITVDEGELRLPLKIREEH
ncbi:MAG: resolvase [Clostridium sp.]|nr:resolvase [Clostridium sp.]MCM1172049.1 resolvase [Clostridium sp.]MCM1209050.1 resolvase [Ruminococcus sp.]MCM1400087.1 resolvase [Clostridium sp.]MCM1459637.1 hypothetical protein [Bacteroides sp.]